METHERTIIKTISYRIIGTFITGVLGWLFTGKAALGLGLGLTDTFIKLFVFYFHERAWTKIDIGYVKKVNVNGDGI